MFLTISRKDILDLYDITNFIEFKNSIRHMAVNSISEDIKEFMEPLIDDPNTPDLDPILTS